MTVASGFGNGWPAEATDADPGLPSVRARAPFLHAGCATTLADRFGACATPGHGNTSQLTPGQISDLVAYLETL